MTELTTEQRIQKLERLVLANEKRWRWLRVWIMVFTVLVGFAIWKQRSDNAQRSRDRNAQIAAIVNAGHQECVHSFTALTTILNIVFPPDEIKNLKKPDQIRAGELFEAADPKIQCPPQTLTKAQSQQIEKAKKGNSG